MSRLSIMQEMGLGWCEPESYNNDWLVKMCPPSSEKLPYVVDDDAETLIWSTCREQETVVCSDVDEMRTAYCPHLKAQGISWNREWKDWKIPRWRMTNRTVSHLNPKQIVIACRRLVQAQSRQNSSMRGIKTSPLAEEIYATLYSSFQALKVHIVSVLTNSTALKQFSFQSVVCKI